MFSFQFHRNKAELLSDFVDWSDLTQCYGVVPKGLLTFLGSLYEEVAKTTSGTLVYRFERQTAKKKKKTPTKIFLQKTVSST